MGLPRQHTLKYVRIPPYQSSPWPHGLPMFQLRALIHRRHETLSRPLRNPRLFESVCWGVCTHGECKVWQRRQKYWKHWWLMGSNLQQIHWKIWRCCHRQWPLRNKNYSWLSWYFQWGNFTQSLIQKSLRFHQQKGNLPWLRPIWRRYISWL